MLPAVGETLDLGHWTVGAEFVAEYLGVVENRSLIYGELDAVPPMALAARAVGAASTSAGLTSRYGPRRARAEVQGG